jgi:hypothetical protein
VVEPQIWRCEQAQTRSHLQIWGLQRKLPVSANWDSFQVSLAIEVSVAMHLTVLGPKIECLVRLRRIKAQ